MDEKNLILLVKSKKELSGLDDSLILETINKMKRKNNIQNISILSKKETKLIIKQTRAELRYFAGFSTSLEKMNNLLEKNSISELISIHPSTRERRDFYPELNKLLNELRISSVLDLGCGLNPLAILEKQKSSNKNINMEYFACDINNNDLEILKKYFAKNKIKGKIFFCDLRKGTEFPQTDICLILKLFDIIERKGHKIAEQIIKRIKSKYLLISFSTKTLSGKPMNHPQRGWIELLLSRLGFSFRIIKFKNEIFYLASKV